MEQNGYPSFTNYGEKYFNEVILFQKGLLNSGKTLQKFSTMGQWFAKGRGKGKIWDEIKASMAEKYGTDPDRTDCVNEQDACNDAIPDTERDNDTDENRTPYCYECPHAHYHHPIKETRRDRWRDWQWFRYSVAVLE